MEAATDAPGQFLETLRGLVAELDDGLGSAWSRDVNETNRSAPPFTWDWIENRLVVTYVAPSFEGELTPGAVVLSVDGVSANEAIAETEKLASAATPQRRRFLALQNLLLGERASSVALDVLPQSGEPYEVAAIRSIDAYIQIEPKARPPIHDLNPGVLYVDLTRIGDIQFDATLPRLEEAEGVIFDLRGNLKVSFSKGTEIIERLTDRTITAQQFFVPVTGRPDREAVSLELLDAWTLEPASRRLEANVVFLIDEQTASGPETILGIIEHYGLAELVGEPTAGTIGGVNRANVPGGYRVYWTGMKVLGPDGSQFHGIGIRPTVPVSRTIQGVAEGRDEILERAIEVVSR